MSTTYSTSSPRLPKNSGNNSGKDDCDDSILVKVDVGYDVVFTVSVNGRSGLLYTMARDLAVTNEPATTATIANNDKVIKLDNYFKMSKLAALINDASSVVYTLFLRRLDNEIIDRDVLTGCLAIYSLTEDHNFFDWLLQQLFDYWTLLSPVLTDEELHEDIINDVWLRCPQQLLPKYLLKDSSFMANWYSCNQDSKEVILNRREKLAYKVVHIAKSVSNSTLSNQPGDEKTTTLSYVRPQSQSRNGQLDVIQSIHKVESYVKKVSQPHQISQTNQVNLDDQGNQTDLVEKVYSYCEHNSVKHGVMIEDHSAVAGRLLSGYQSTKVIKILNQGRETGPIINYRSNSLKTRGYQDDDKVIGLYTHYYDTGKISAVKFYDNDGQQLYSDDYYNDSRNTLARHVDFVDGKEHFEIEYLDGGRYAEVQTQPRQIDFFDANKMLRRRIIDFDVFGKSKLDVYYAKDGVTVTKQQQYGDNWCFDHYHRIWDEIPDYLSEEDDF